MSPGSAPHTASGGGTPARRLIINADDFGLTAGVNRAILELNAAGVLPSATLMSTGQAFRAAAHDAFVQPSLAVGCHVVLVDGSPVLPPSELPGLTEAQGFRRKLGSFVRALVLGRIPEAEMEREAIAQVRRLQSAGITVTHLDTHKHTHIFPQVLRPLLRAARACDVGAIRNPFEPGWAVRATPGAPGKRRMQVRALGLGRQVFRALVRRAGCATTDGSIGVLATGTLDPPTLQRLLHAMPEGTWELVCHPGYQDPDLESAGTRLLGSREIEREALLEVVPRTTDLQLTSFRALSE